jgi:hypothetical protein
MFIVSAARADEATAIMAIKDTRIFFHGWVSGVFIPEQSMLITEKAFDLRAG